MNLENEALKTNEFLRRRKLRLQQVREQSKDIAKKVRQRAKVEKLRAVVELDAKKQQEYFESQDKFVKHLEVLYTRGLENVGAGHQSASDLAGQDRATKVDLSKSRGKEAAAELRRLRQEKLDEQKKLLDRRLQAREAANELSREKSSVLASKLAPKSTDSKLPEVLNQKAADASVATKDNKKDIDKSKTGSENIKTTDIGTQWDMENVPNDWEQVIPALSLPKDDKSPNDLELINLNSKSEKGRRLDLFATSKEMPTSLQGRHTTERDPSTLRPSLTLVSEYLQSRKLRLREPDSTSTNKKPLDDIPSLKQTIQRTRVSKPEEGTYLDVCHVLDEQIIPVPSWQAEQNCQFCTHSVFQHKACLHDKQLNTCTTYTNSQIHKIFSTGKPKQQSGDQLHPRPLLTGRSPFQSRSKICPEHCKL